MLPQAGGPYAYVLRTFGPLPGFLIMWGYVVLIAGPFWAFLAYTAALYIVKPVFPDCQPDQVDTAVKLLAGWIMSEYTAPCWSSVCWRAARGSSGGGLWESWWGAMGVL